MLRIIIFSFILVIANNAFAIDKSYRDYSSLINLFDEITTKDYSDFELADKVIISENAGIRSKYSVEDLKKQRKCRTYDDNSVLESDFDYLTWRTILRDPSKKEKRDFMDLLFNDTKSVTICTIFSRSNSDKYVDEYFYVSGDEDYTFYYAVYSTKQ